MNPLSLDALAAYWSGPEIATNIIIFLNILGALILGLFVGYERSYHGRAAGMRTYGLVCMASAALTAIAGYPTYWYGGQVASFIGDDPTRVIQGIVTGVGFLGAGVIMREGLNISGLTTAASIWASSAIGVMVGIGFYVAAILLAMLSAICMLWVSKLENWLPSRKAVAVVLKFKQGFKPSEKNLHERAFSHGYEIANGTLSISSKDGAPEWHFVAIALGKNRGAPMSALAQELTDSEGVDSFLLTHARN